MGSRAAVDIHERKWEKIGMQRAFALLIRMLVNIRALWILALVGGTLVKNSTLLVLKVAILKLLKSTMFFYIHTYVLKYILGTQT